MYRLPIDHKSGKHTVVVQIPDRKELNGSYMRYIADQLCVRHDQVNEVLDDWSQEKLVKHLKKQSAERLRRGIFGIK